MSSIKDLLEKPLIKQLIKFGIVGVLAFVVEILCLNLLTAFIPNIPLMSGFSKDTYTLIATPIAFVVSLLFNYILSLAFVFKRRKDVGQKQVFTIFLVLNLIALLLNWFLMWIFVSAMFDFEQNIAKVMATFLVMIYNFITRKIFVEDHSDKK